MVQFKDHFSTQSESYSNYRPEYPQELYTFLKKQCETHNLAWDCATGNGQAAKGLAPFFDHIYATDASAAQISNASGPKNVKFAVVEATNSQLESNSVDLITVAQALHWFDVDLFYEEVRRVLKPSGVLGVWCYGALTVDGQIDDVYSDYYQNKVGSYWPPERGHIENEYAQLKFPLDEINTPNFIMETRWTLDAFLGYLRSWSATNRYITDNGYDPVDELHEELISFWPLGTTKKVCWPMTIKVGKMKT